MSEYRVASRYAKSLLELSKERGILDAVRDDMKAFLQVCKENRDFVLMLQNPIIKHDMKNAILRKVFTGNVNDLTLATFDLLTKKKRESFLPGIAKEFEAQYNIDKGIEEATVRTTVPLTKELRSSIEEIVKKISTKKSVQLTEIIDEDLIGGFVLKVGDKQLDDSIKSKLKALELKFKQNPYIKEF